MTQQEFNEMLAVAIAGGLGGGTYISRWDGEQIDAAVDKLQLPGGIVTADLADGAVTWPKLAVDARPIRGNLLINPILIGGGSQQGGGQFPINQRGKTEYQGAAYGIDGWNGRISNQKIVLTADCVEIHSGANQADLGQPFQVPTVLIGETVTFSALVKGDGIFAPNIGILSNTQQGNTAGLPSAVWQLLTTTVTLNPSESAAGIVRPRIFLGAANSQNLTPICYIKAAALELGDHCTAFSQDSDGNWVINEIPDYGEELRKCQRYQNINGGLYAPYYCTVGSLQFCFLPLPTTLRGTPTLYGTPIVRKVSDNSVVSNAAVTVSASVNNGVVLSVSGADSPVYIYGMNWGVDSNL